MRTTIRLDDDLMAAAKRAAAASGRSLTSFVEDAVRAALSPRPDGTSRAAEVRLPTWGKGKGGTLPGIDLDDSAALLDAMVAGARGASE